MIKQEIKFFKELSEHRADLAKALDDPALRGVKTSVVEKYSDQAHFIYELLQNADDAKATKVSFELYEDKLIFKHNGTKRFSISNQQTEEEDKKLGKLGDINAITSIANSSKIDSTIGKFGVGFKSVFQYTLTPHIYDPSLNFKIHSFIVPVQLEDDYPGRQSDETLFMFPFDYPERPANIAFEDIADKLRSLDFPILFLPNLEGIQFNILNERGMYGKVIEKEQHVNKTSQQLVTLKQQDNKGLIEEKLWLFSRTNAANQTYSVGFFIDSEGKLVAKQYSAFCFFSTKEVTNLNFIIHAPFLLTDSREGIKTSAAHNYEMIGLLSKLAADCLIYLRDIGIAQEQQLITDDIFDIIPYKKDAFNEISDKRKISFKPFYDEILKAMQEENILPTSKGYTTKEKGCWASVPQITKLFADVQLQDLSSIEESEWVFNSFGRNETARKNSELTSYIESIVKTWIDEEAIISGRKKYPMQFIDGITANFIEHQSHEWLHQFYDWIAETKTRINLVKHKPIFLDQSQQAVAALDEKSQIILFIDTDVDGYKIVLPTLLKNEKTRKFIIDLGVKKPSVRDEIYNHILPIYKNNQDSIDTGRHFLKFFTYYTQCSKSESAEFIGLIKNYKFIRCMFDNKIYRDEAKYLYLPTEELKRWFAAVTATKFVEFDSYLSLVGQDKEEQLIEFLKDLGVSDKPRIFSCYLSRDEAQKIKSDWHRSTGGATWIEHKIDGCHENLLKIVKDRDKELSIFVWECLLKYCDVYAQQQKLFQVVNGKYSYYFRTDKVEYYDSSHITCLRKIPWLVTEVGDFVSPQQLEIDCLASDYDTHSDQESTLFKILQLINSTNDNDNLTDEQREKIRRAELIGDIPIEELQQFAQQYRMKKTTQPVDEEENDPTTLTPKTPEARVAEEIGKRAATKNSTQIKLEEDDSLDAEPVDEDEYTKPSVDFSKKIERAKEKSAHEIARIARLDELTQQALKTTKYSYGWFKALLDLEAFNQEENTYSREISISFAKVEREENTSRILILKHPNRYIPHSIEDLADIPLDIYMQNGEKVRAVVEVVNVKSYTLRAKLKPNVQLDKVDLSQVQEAKIEAKNPVFLLEELRRAFSSLEFADDWNMQTNLCKNIEFVFGPPGTGKTTHLANKIILPLMTNESPKVLVLAPTNKAADVLVRRIMELDPQQSYKEWLIRFGATNDSTIEQSGVFYDKSIDIQSFTKNVTVTTIARFPYDFYMPNDGKRLHLSEMNWDYIIIDEASMIPLVNIIFPLYKKTPKKFIIAGDPFQIEPITTVDLWKNENIYTLVQLNSFANPQTEPYKYDVTLLTKQYRSVPTIGEVFSRLTYDGILEHHRTVARDIEPDIVDKLDLQPLTIMKFPVSKYESIFKPKSLQNRSNYHIYSALFTFEYVKYIADLFKHNRDVFRIGIIAPYRAQADMLDKLMSSYQFPDTVDLQVGTIHGFQGDECDMIIALFNPPASISKSNEMFLNKLNIINVAVSRARDYLVVVMPDENTEKVENLTLINKVEEIIKSQPQWAEFATGELEGRIFGSNTYLEDNSFSTSHQLVNVYGKPEKKYEIRSETSAVDIQIYDYLP